MINNIWFFMIVSSLIFGIARGNVKEMTEGIINSSVQTVELCISFIGIWALWLGLMEIVKSSGLVDKISRFIHPIAKKLFPAVPEDHPALGAITLNLTANMLGLGNAATPLGLEAMRELQSLNSKKDYASDAMCMFLAINTSSIQLIPTTVIAIRSSLGSNEPASIIVSSIIATTVSTFAAITASAYLRNKYKCKSEQEYNRG